MVDGELSIGMSPPEKCVFNNMWSRCDLDLWPFKLKIQLVHICPQPRW